MKLYLLKKYPYYSLNNSLPFTNVLVTFPCNFLSSIEVFFDFETNFSFFTIQGLSISTIHRSASFPMDKLPLSSFNIFAGFEVRAFIIVSSLRVLHGRESFTPNGKRYLQDAYFVYDNALNNCVI